MLIMFRKLAREMIKNQSGVALPMALILLVVATFIVVPGLWATGSMIKVNQALENDTLAYYAAKSGIEDAMWTFKNGGTPGWTGSPPSYTPYLLPGTPVNGMTVKVTRVYLVASGPFTNTYTVKSEAVDSSNNTLRTIYGEVVVNSGSSPFEYGIVALDGNIAMSGSTKVLSTPVNNADIFSNGSITFSDGAYNDGTATAYSTINRCPPLGCYPNQPKVQFALIDMAPYVLGANYTNPVWVGETYTPIDGATLKGTYKGDMEIRKNVTLGGMVWVTGHILIKGGQITGTGNPDTNYLMANDYIKFETGGTKVFNHPTIISWNSYISFEQKTEGDLGTIYAPKGTISMKNNNNVVGSVVGKSVSMENGSQITYPVNNPNIMAGMSGGSSVTLTRYLGQ
jgi:Tfp pilus assembly protein PilX